MKRVTLKPITGESPKEKQSGVVVGRSSGRPTLLP